MDTFSNFFQLISYEFNRFKVRCDKNYKNCNTLQKVFTCEIHNNQINKFRQKDLMTDVELKDWIKTIFSSQSISYLIQTYIECLGYLFPVLIAYLLTESLKIALFVLSMVILMRFLLAFYYLKKCRQQPSYTVKYASCHCGHQIDPIQKAKLIKDCEVKYEEFKKQQNGLTSSQKKLKQDQREQVVKQLEAKELIIMNKWD